MQNRKNIIKENQLQMESLETYINDKLAELNALRNKNISLKTERVEYLRSWHNSHLDNDYNLQKVLDFLSVSYLPDYSYTIESIKKLLHHQTLNNERYRTERNLYRGISAYINDNSFEYVTPNDVASLVKKYKTQNAKHLIKKLNLERKLQARKARLIELTVGNRGARLWERRNMMDYDRANFWYGAKMSTFVHNTVTKFEKLLSDNGIQEYYGIMFERYSSDVKKWHEDITKNHTMTLGQLKAMAYKKIKERYINNVNRHNTKQYDDIKQLAKEKHQLATMTAKDRKKLQFEKWSKVKNVLNMFSGAIEIDKKIDFDNYVPVTPAPTKESVKQVINNCGLVETHETFSDGTTTVSIYA